MRGLQTNLIAPGSRDDSLTVARLYGFHYALIDACHPGPRGNELRSVHNPFGDKADGKWVEQCLGAVVKAKCYLVLEDALGYRWIQEVSDTAMQSSDPIRGSDYDL